MSQRRPVVEVIDDQMAEIFRGMTGGQRLAMVFDLWDSVRLLVRSSVFAQQPDWNVDKVEAETVRRMAHDDQF